MKLHIETKIEINSSPKKIWDTLINFPNWEKWNPSITKVVGDLKEGNKLYIEFFQNGKLRKGHPVVLKSDPEKELKWKGSLPIPGLFTGEHYFKIEKISDSKSLFIHGEYFQGLLISFLFKDPKIVESKYQMVNESLKKYLE